MNLLQALSLCFIWPWNKTLYRHLVQTFQYGHWAIVANMAWTWSDSKLKVYCTDEDLPYIGKEAAIWVANHRYSLDFLSTVMIPDQFGVLGLLKAFQKIEIKWLPVVGWNFWFTENIFLRRSATRDIAAIQNGTENLVKSKLPFWLVLYAEGTRFSAAKHVASEEFAKGKNYPSLKHHLQPRPTGFVEVIKVLKTVKDQNVALYDMTIQLDGNTDRKMTEVIARRPITFHCFLRRIDPHTVPKDGEAEWLRKLYQEKDARFDMLLNNNTLDSYTPKFPPSSTPVKEQKLSTPTGSKYMYLFWFFTVIPCVIYLLIKLILSSTMGLVLGISIPIICISVCQFLVNKIIRSGDMQSSSSYGLKKTT